MRKVVFGALLVAALTLFVGCGSSSPPAGAQGNTVQVTLSDFKVQAATTTFTAGKTYHFVVTNAGGTAHEFMIMPQMTDMAGMSMDKAHSMALTMIDQIKPGESKTLDYTFATNASGGMSGMQASSQALEFACMLPGHYQAGMHLPAMLKPAQ